MDHFPYLGNDALRALELLATPLHIYSFETKSICWANAEARHVWLAQSGQELNDREISNQSEAVSTRLAEYRQAFHRGEERNESWTFYPKGHATTALCRCTGVSLDGHAEAMLVEIRSLSEAELPVSELRAIEALRHTPLMISLFSQQGRVLMRNPAAIACFEKSDAKQARGANQFRAMFADPAIAMLLLEEARSAGSARRMATMAIDKWPVHSLDVTMVQDPATGQPAVLVAQQDVSMLVEIGRQLAASEDALQSVLELNVIPVIVVSARDGRILQANHAAEQFLATAHLEGEDFGRFAANAELYREFFGKVLSSAAGNEIMQLRDDHGKALWASIAGARIVYRKHDSVAILITDIGALQQNAEDLEAALDSERRITDMQRRSLAIASHELRTPLAIIDSAAQRLERGAADIAPDQIRGRAARIRSSVKQLLQLLDNTIGQARSNAETLQYAPAPGDIGQCIADVAQGFIESNPSLSVDLRLPALPTLSFDRSLIEQTFANLFANSIRYADGPPRVEISVAVTSEDIQFLFRDWGIGVPEGEWNRVFADCVRGSNIEDRPGTGLGLSIAAQAIRLHGGLIEIVATEGPGTTFRITLPRP